MPWHRTHLSCPRLGRLTLNSTSRRSAPIPGPHDLSPCIIHRIAPAPHASLVIFLCVDVKARKEGFLRRGASWLKKLREGISIQQLLSPTLGQTIIDSPSRYPKASAAGILMHVHISTIQPHSSDCSCYFRFMYFLPEPGGGTECTMTSPINVVQLYCQRDNVPNVKERSCSRPYTDYHGWISR